MTNLIANYIKTISDQGKKIIDLVKQLEAAKLRIKSLKEREELLNRNCKDWMDKYKTLEKEYEELQMSVSLNDVLQGEKVAKFLQIKKFKDMSCIDKCINYKEKHIIKG